MAPFGVRGRQDSYRSPPVQRSTSTTPSSVFQYDNKTDLEVNNTGYLMTLMMLGEWVRIQCRIQEEISQSLQSYKITFDRDAWGCSIRSLGSRVNHQEKTRLRRPSGGRIRIIIHFNVFYSILYLPPGLVLCPYSLHLSIQVLECRYLTALIRD